MADMGNPAIANLDDLTVFAELKSEGVPLRASARFGDGLAAASWQRDEVAFTSYKAPNHHTLSLYVTGGNGFRRLNKEAGVPEGSRSGCLCLMPAGLTTDWQVNGPIDLFHLYVPEAAFGRVVLETLDLDPARVSLRDETFFHDGTIEALVRSAVLPLSWDEPAERVAVTHAGQALLAYLAARFTSRDLSRLLARGGLSPRALRQVAEYVDANLDAAISIDDLAAVAQLSPFHFARMFKQSTGESPHGYVTRQRVEQAQRLLAEGSLPLADVALACGFSSQSHFTLRFRELTGVTPRQYSRAAGR
jgi:AraC family transcriptional regulator